MGVMGEARTLDKPHNEKRIRLVFAYFINRDDVRMIEFGGSFCFAAKAGQHCGRGQVPKADHLYGHKPIEGALASPIDHPHPSASDSFQDFIIPESEFPITAGT